MLVSAAVRPQSQQIRFSLKLPTWANFQILGRLAKMMRDANCVPAPAIHQAVRSRVCKTGENLIFCLEADDRVLETRDRR